MNYWKLKIDLSFRQVNGQRAFNGLHKQASCNAMQLACYSNWEEAQFQCFKILNSCWMWLKNYISLIPLVVQSKRMSWSVQPCVCVACSLCSCITLHMVVWWCGQIKRQRLKFAHFVWSFPCCWSKLLFLFLEEAKNKKHSPFLCLIFCEEQTLLLLLNKETGFKLS